MSASLDGKYALIRNAWIAALRREGHRQCREVLARDGYQVCALAILAEVAGIKAADIPSRKNQIGPLAGLSSEPQVCALALLGEVAGIKATEIESLENQVGA